MSAKKRRSTKSKTTKKAAVKKPAVSVAKSSAATTSNVTPEMSLTQLVLLYVVFFVVNSVVVLVANTLTPDQVVLGTHMIKPLTGLIQSMAVFSLITVAASPVIEAVADQMKYRLQFWHWIVLYAAINFGGLWLTARFAEQLGLGLASWMVVLVLAIVMDLAQGAAVALTQEKK